MRSFKHQIKIGKVFTMKHIMFLTAAALFAAVGLAAADTKDLGPNLPDPDAPVEIRVTSGDANKEIAAKVGEFIVIELDGNATTGYSWSELPGRTDPVLESKGNEYVARQRPGMVGGGGKAFFRYLVKEPGTTEIKLGYARPWEKDTPPARLFNVKIRAGAAATEAAKGAPELVALTEKDNGGTVRVVPGAKIRIQLNSNPTTGYSWALTGKPDEKVLKSDGNEYKVNDHPAGMVGVGGVDTWTFSALAAGKTELALAYARPWEKDKEPAQAFKLTVVVDSAAAPAQADEAKDSKPEAKEFALGDKDSGKTIEIHVGDSVKLVLDANPTTGFSWEKTDKVDKNILKLESNDYRQNANPAGMVGVGGRTTIVYRAVKAGTAKIDLTYMQPWEPDSEFNTNYTVTVKVK